MEENSEILQIKPVKQINYQFKILYAMLMYGVLCGHMVVVDSFVPFTELFSLYGFGIQLFLFISGYFYNIKNDKKIVDFFLKKVKTLLVPYFLWNVFYGVLCWFLYKIGFTISKPLSFKTLFIDSFAGVPAFFFNSPTWFIVPFFIAEIFTVLERRLFLKWDSYKKDILIISVNFIISFSGIYLSKKYVNDTGYVIMKLSAITKAMFMLPYFSLGFIYKTYLEKKDTLSSRWYFLIFTLLSVIYILFNGHTSSYFVVIMGGFENPFTPLFVSIIGIAVWLRVAKILTPVIGKSKWIVAIGDNTFAIMTHHMLGFFILELILMVCSKLLPFLPEFDMNQFLANANYRYLPRGRGFPIIYIIFGFVFSIYFQKLLNKLKNIFQKLFQLYF